MRVEKALTFVAALVASPFVAAIPTAQSATRTMKAVVIHEYGGPEVLKYEDVPRPEPKDDQLLVRVIAAGVNPVVGPIRSGMFDNENRNFPIIMGGDIARVAERVRNKGMKFKVGEPVCAYVSVNH